MTRTRQIKEYTITTGSRTRCTFCRRRLVIQWANGRRRLWACVWHTRRAWRALDDPREGPW
jgi:hypothetical protein